LASPSGAPAVPSPVSVSSCWTAPPADSAYVISNVVGSCDPFAIAEPYAITLPEPEITSTSMRALSVEIAGKWSLNATCRWENSRTCRSSEPRNPPLSSKTLTRTVALCPVVSTNP
jgi:hypothetical protein